MHAKRSLCLITVLVLVTIYDARAALTTNKWRQAGGGKWETGANWTTNNPPSLIDAVDIINTGVVNTIIVDDTTVVSNVVNGCMTVSNLVVAVVPFATNTLRVSNTVITSGTITTIVPLHLLNSLTLTNGGALIITNATLQVDGLSGGGFTIEGPATNFIGGLIVTTNVTTTIGNTSSGNFTMMGGTWLASNVIVGANASSQGTLTLAAGTNLVSTLLSIGLNPNSTGTVWATGGQLIVTNFNFNGSILVGNGGIGQVAVSNGTVVSRDFRVGVSSRGTLTQAGGTNQMTADLVIGLNPGSTGTVWVTGGRLETIEPTISAGTITVGSFGTGMMIVSNGTVHARYLVLAQNIVQGTVTLAGGLLDMTQSTPGTVDVGLNGTGVFNISGGTALMNNISIGSALAAVGTGTLWMTSGQLTVTNGNFLVGGGDTGQMTLSNGFVFATNLTVGSFGNGTMTMAGGTNSLSGNFNFASSATKTGTVWLTGGQLVVTNAPTTIGFSGAGRMTISNGIFLAKSVQLGSNTTANGTLTVAGGTNALIGPLTVGVLGTGTVWMTGGQLVVTNTPATVGAGTGFVIDGGVTLTNGSSISLSNVNVVIGNSGSGSLTVFGGTMSASGSLTLGRSAGTTGTLWMNGGTLSCATNGIAQLVIGRAGQGAMVVSNGTVQVDQAFAGSAPGGSGTLTIVGGQFLSPLSGLSLATSLPCTGTVWLTGGVLALTNSITTASIFTHDGLARLTVSNGLLLADNVLIASLSLTSLGAGTFTFAGGTSIINTNMILGNYACAGGQGNVIVTGGSVFVTNASHTAVLEVRNGTLELDSGTLVVDQLVITNACGRFIRTGGTLIYSQLVLDPNLSAVGDGIPNGWKQQYGLDPFDPNLGNEDPDGDGCNNLCEFLGGSNPVADIKAITKEGNDIRVTWQSAAAKTNALQRTAGAGDGSYLTNGFVDLFTVTNNLGAITNYLDVGGATNFPARYYRVRLVP